MRKSFSSYSSRRTARRKAKPARPDGRHAPGARARVARRRTCEVDAQIVILLDLPDRPAVMVPEIEAIEQHLARLIDDLLG